MQKPNRRLRASGLIVAGVVVALGAASVPAAVASAAGSAARADVPQVVPTPPTPPVAPPASTRPVVHGWGAAPRAVTAGRPFTVRVRVAGTGAGRLVLLERFRGHAWHAVVRARSDAAGRAVLSRGVPRHAGRVALRVRVPRTADSAGTVTSYRWVQVRPAGAVPPAPTPVPSAPVASASPSAAPVPAAEARRQELLVLVNRARATARTCGPTSYPAAAPLVRDAALDRAADGFATELASRKEFSHTGTDGSTPGDRLRRVGITGVAWAENIAAGQTSPTAAMSAWLTSPGHCANIMSRSVARIGFGYATGGQYGRYWVQDFAGSR